jgi:AcrR family transcriptional regulator
VVPATTTKDGILANHKRTTAAKGHSRTRYELVENELLARAADLFAERGYNGTSLQDIADTMGMTRPAIYHYFENKDALLVALVDGVTEGREALLRSIRHDPTLTPEAKLEQAVQQMALQVAEYSARFRLLILSASDLPKRIATQNERARRDVTAHLTAIIAEGIAAGTLHDVDAQVASYVIVGMCNSIAWWLQPDGRITPQAVADLVTELSLRSLKRSRRVPVRRSAS